MDSSTFPANLFQEDLYVIWENTDDRLKVESPILSEPIRESKRESKSSEHAGFKGKNKKGIVVLIDYPEVGGIPPDQEELLRKILTSIQLTLEDVLVVNTSLYQEEILSFGEKILSFGVLSIAGYDGPVNTYEIIKSERNILLIADHLHLLSEHNDLKLKLWRNLQVMFL